MVDGRSADRTAADGSPYPDRTRASFERDVQAMFTHIARRYDWFDHVASLGNDYLWRPRALWEVDRYRHHRAPHRILDFGCGTGDLTRLAARHFDGADVVGLDFTSAMLSLAHGRTLGTPEAPRVRYVRGSVRHLPFCDGQFDLVMSAFVARNLPDLSEAFREVGRVLAPGGTVLTLEITEPSSVTFRALFHAYFDRFVPWLGVAVKSAGPYRYLPESLRHLPGRAEFLSLLERAGLTRVGVRTQSMGVVSAYLAERPPPVSPQAQYPPAVASSAVGAR